MVHSAGVAVHRTRWVGLTLIGVGIVVLGVLLLPYSVGRGDGSDSEHSCIAVRDGWQSGPPKPTASEFRAYNAHVLSLGSVTPSQDRAAALLSAERAWQQSASVQRVNAYVHWYESGGKCGVHGGQDRIRLAALGVAAIVVGLTAIWLWNRRAESRLLSSPEVGHAV
jgi:hypothetical protein